MNESRTGLLDVLQQHGFDVNRKFKLVRHREPTKGYDMDHFRAQGWLKWYQSYQAKPVFDGLNCIVVFIGVGSTQARFYGIYEVLSRVPSEQGPAPPEALRLRTGGEDWRAPGWYYYT